MKLKELADLLLIKDVKGDMQVEVRGISMHSKHVEPGDLFVCIPGVSGFQEDRHPYAREAVEAGASALLVERDVGLDVPTVKVPDARYAMAVAAAHLYGYPSRALKLIGVTGTNGKTTTSHMIEALLSHAGCKTGLMGNLGTKIGSALLETGINTQEPPSLQANLRRMKEAQASHAVMEVSSQGLDMGRVLGCEFRTAVFTNLTQDHLDYHGTMEAYRAAKGLLFSRMGDGWAADPDSRKYAVLNADDPASDYYRRVTAAQTLTYGVTNPADVMAKDIALTARGTQFRLSTYAGDTEASLPMVGLFNVYNALAAVAAVLAEGVALPVIREGLARFGGVPGRMEIIDEGQDYLVIADYAHTPDGLDKVLSTIRGFAGARVITVFGCGGDRDRGKRPVMGELAARYSDVVIATSDNPRSEAPEQILEDIRKGLAEAGASGYELIEDRRTAIGRAIGLAQPGDVVLLAGKGHETYQILKDRTIHLDDREEAREAIRRRRQGS